MKRRILPLLLLLAASLSGAPLSAQENQNDLFQKGCEAYSREAYENAAQAFLQLARTEHNSPAVLFNLGNTFYKMGEPAQAVLWYNRALLLSPGDPDIHTNLRIAREDLGLITPEEEREAASRSNPWTLSKDWILRHRLSTWRNLALTGYWITALLLLIRLWLPKTRSQPVWPTWSVATLTLACTAAWMIAAADLLSLPKAVVLGSNPPARYAPLADASVRFDLKTGEKIDLVDQINGWYKIRRPGKTEEAFIPKTEAEPISLGAFLK